MDSGEPFLKRHWPHTLVSVISVILVAILILGYAYGWGWVGVVEYQLFVNDQLEEFQRQKTLWDWLDLLIVPSVLGFGVWWLNKRQKETEKEIAEKNREEERKNEDLKRQQDTLERYFDRMANLFAQGRIGPRVKIESLATGMTLTVLRRLNGHQKGDVIRFLYGAKLIEIGSHLVTLKGANLRKAYLKQADLRNSDLSGTHLDGAFLDEADLRGTNLSDASLTDAYLNSTDLRGVVLNGVRVRGADLTMTDLRGTDLSKITLGEYVVELDDSDKFASPKGDDLKEWWVEANFDLAKYDAATKWPRGFDAKAAGAILVDEDGNQVDDSG